jgi:chromosome segregation ATPase
MVPVASDPAEARKRRKEIIQSQRLDGEATSASANNNEDVVVAAASAAAPMANVPLTEDEEADKKPPKKRKVDDLTEKDTDTENARKKTQIRYDPDVPMSKDQLAAWRREARRVRNRESAAASRQRIRNRISELEDEVGDWKTKYAQAMQRLESLQQAVATNGEVI